MPSKGAGIVDVARRAGVSTSTVSKAFNNRGDISAAVRQRILSVAAELHYVPNALIRSLRQGRSDTIGVFAWEAVKQPYRSIQPTFARGMATGIKELGCDMLTYSRLPGRTPESMAATFLDGRVDGVIAAAGDISESSLLALADAKLPTVIVFSRNVPPGIGYVAIDNRSGVSEAVDHLVNLGHTRVGFYSPMATFDYDERLAAMEERLAYHGIPVDRARCIVGRHGRPSIDEACETFVGGDRPVTAVFGGDDDIAYQMMLALDGRGLRVPEDISVVGFDGLAQDYSIRLTSVKQPAYDVGRTAATFVGQMIRGVPAEECRALLPVSFVPSDSTGKPSRRA